MHVNGKPTRFLTLPNSETSVTCIMSATAFVQQAVAKTFGVNKVAKVSLSKMCLRTDRETGWSSRLVRLEGSRTDVMLHRANGKL